MLNILPVIIFYLIISVPIYSQQESLSVVRACDFDGSGVIDVGDFLLFVDSFGTNEEKYDLDGDGEVAVSDFLIFVDHFGKEVPPPSNPDPPPSNPDPPPSNPNPPPSNPDPPPSNPDPPPSNPVNNGESIHHRIPVLRAILP